MKIVALKYAESVYGERFIFRGGNRERLLPISFVIYLIQTDNKNILIDAGCEECSGFIMSICKKPTELLREYGLSPQDITDVVITHAHHDHIASVGDYTNAVIHIQREEYDFGKKYIPDNLQVSLFDDEEQLTDDVFVRKIGGHSIGSSIVIADRYVFCGDECYYEKNLTEKIMSGSIYCLENHRAFMKEYSKDRYTPLMFHDPEILKGEVGYININ